MGFLDAFKAAGALSGASWFETRGVAALLTMRGEASS
jgi:hypothetical protein